MSLRIMLIDWCLISLFWTVIPALAQEHHEGHSAAELNKQFQNPNLDISRFVDRFETDSREIFAQRRKIVEAVSLHPGQTVADIGAGTGLFSWMFAEKVGPKGTVYAVEIAPAFLKLHGRAGPQARLGEGGKTCPEHARHDEPGSRFDRRGLRLCHLPPFRAPGKGAGLDPSIAPSGWAACRH